MKKLFTLLAVTALFSTLASAQQEPQFSQNMFTNLEINPAYAGANQAICITGLFRKQWLGFDGSPTTMLLMFDAPVGNHGFGIDLVSDKLGFENNTIFKLAYAHRFQLGPGTIRGGLMVGFHNKSLDFSKLKPEDAFPAEGTQWSNDPLIKSITSKESDMIFDIATGVYYEIQDKLYVGLSFSQLLGSSGEYSSTVAPINFKQHAYFTAGYTHQLNQDIDLLPSLLVKTDFSSTQFDINCLGLYQKKYWGGLSYRLQDAVVLMFGAYLPKDIKAGYAYDFTTSAIGANGRSSGSHEIMVGYCFRIIVEPKISSYKNVRFL
ncbi:MAG: type IX secretion system membrane protein PorP/SprF [Bacteroidetes bacterium]|nr:type IX secretion system membrane protein PorP/SprF [Bacteroidota bacterium]MBU1717710.1 type IX secretion system membrane protein PorP/SprF [Bacteroidota bacterium]